MSDQTLATRPANGLAVLETGGLDETIKLGEILAESGYFADTKSTAQAVVKVLAGRELGFGAVASLTGVSIVQGRPTIGANLMAALVKRSRRYDYRVKTLTEQAAVIVFFEYGQTVGESPFTIQDATKAGLTGRDNWKHYARNMLFARALSNGVRWFCPDLTGGPIYTPDELDGETNPDQIPALVGYINHDTGEVLPADEGEPAEATESPLVEQPAHAMWDRYHELLDEAQRINQEAKQLVIGIPNVREGQTPRTDLAKAGKALKGAIEQYRANQATKPMAAR